MFIKLSKQQPVFKPVTDVIKNGKKQSRYKSILNILKTIHILFTPNKQTEEVLD